MIIREARTEDIPRIQIVRNSVTENTLSDPNLVTDEDCKEFINIRGRGWVCEVNGHLVGFSIVDLKDHNIWALFLVPEFEKQGIGKNFTISCLTGILHRQTLRYGWGPHPVHVQRNFTEKQAGQKPACMGKRN